MTYIIEKKFFSTWVFFHLFTQPELLKLKMKNGKIRLFNCNLLKAEFGNTKFVNLDLSVSTWKDRTCPSLPYILTPDVSKPQTTEILEAAKSLRDSISSSVGQRCTNPSHSNIDMAFSFKHTTSDHSSPDKFKQLPLRASEFNSGRTDHVSLINRLGITINTIADGRIQLVHKTADAVGFEEAELGWKLVSLKRLIILFNRYFQRYFIHDRYAGVLEKPETQDSHKQ